MPLIDVKDERPELDPAALARGLNAVAAELGVPVETVQGLPWAELTPIMKRLSDQAERGQREAAREVLIAENLAALLAPLAEDMTIEQGIAAGLIAEADAVAAEDVTDAEVDASLAAADWPRRAKGRARRRAKGTRP